MNIKYQLKLFYIFGLYHIFYNLLYLQMFTQDFTRSPLEILWPVKILSFIPSNLIFYIIFGFLVGINILCIFRTYSRILRTLYFLLWGFFISLIHSNYGIDHEYFLWLYTSFALIFSPKMDDQTNPDISSVESFYHHLTFMILATYAIAGFWKGLAFLTSANNSSWNLSYVFAKQMVITNNTSPLLDFMLEYFPNDHLMILSPLIQMIPLFFYRKNILLPLFGILFILIHLLNYYAMDILFTSNIFILLIFFVLHPLVIETFKKNYKFQIR